MPRRGDASEDFPFLVSKDGSKILQATVYDVNSNPFKPDLDKLKTEFQPSFGTPGAPVVLVAFSDFECPVCKTEATMLRQNLLTAYPTQVRLYFKDFPLESIHPWAKPAAIAGRCVFRQNPSSFWSYSRLDLRPPGRHHRREPEGQGNGVGQGTRKTSMCCSLASAWTPRLPKPRWTRTSPRATRSTSMPLPPCS